MSTRANKRPSALKHAGYSATTLLPGENPAAFEKLYRELIDEIAPAGALEDDLVATIAHLVWRKQNLATYLLAANTRDRYSDIENEICLETFFDLSRFDKLEAVLQAADEQARKELGWRYALLEIGDSATVDNLMKELDVLERLDASIERCMKRLLFVRGVKSISATASCVPRARIQGPPKAA